MENKLKIFELHQLTLPGVEPTVIGEGAPVIHGPTDLRQARLDLELSYFAARHDVVIYEPYMYRLGEEMKQYVETDPRYKKIAASLGVLEPRISHARMEMERIKPLISKKSDSYVESQTTPTEDNLTT